MSGTVSYASAARSAASKESKDSKDPKDSQSTTSGATSPSTTSLEVESSSPISQVPLATTEPESASANSKSVPTVSFEAPASSNSSLVDEKETDLSKDIASINKDKVSLTPAPVPKVNAWGVKPVASAVHISPAITSTPTTSEPSPDSSNSTLTAAQAQQASLNPVQWPKPDEGTPTVADNIEAPAAVTPVATKGRAKNWVPISYTPVTSKPRSNKTTRSGNSGKSTLNNSASATGSTPSNSNGSPSAGSKGRGGPKNFAAKAGPPGKKTDGKAPVKAQVSQRTESVSSATSNSGKSDAPKAKPVPNSAPVAPNSKVPGPKKNRPTNGSTSADAQDSNGTFSHQSNGFHQNHHTSHHNHHANGGQHNPNHHNNRSPSVPSGNGGNFPQQYVPYSNTRRSSQMGHYNGSKYFVPDYTLYNQMYQAPPGQNQYEMTLTSVAYQIEYYFSVENLCKDMYMRKLMNSNGWIPLASLAAFNRLNSLTGGDFNLFLEACKWAPSVEVAGEKIRLHHGWEHWVFPLADRLPAGKDEELPATVKLVFNPAAAAPFVPMSEAADAPSSSQ